MYLIYLIVNCLQAFYNIRLHDNSRSYIYIILNSLGGHRLDHRLGYLFSSKGRGGRDEPRETFRISFRTFDILLVSYVHAILCSFLIPFFSAVKVTMYEIVEALHVSFLLIWLLN